MMKKFILIQIIFYSLGFGQKVWWVDLKTGNDSNAGDTEAAAFKTVHQALETNSWSSGDTIKVKPSLASDGSLSYYDFGGKSISLTTSNDFVLIGTSGADSTIFNAEGKNRHISFYYGTSTRATKIQGIKFFNGDETNNSNSGGSLQIYGSQQKMQFIECIFDSNRVDHGTGSSVSSGGSGGAIEISQSKPIFIKCTFKNNYVVGQNAQGGAVRISYPDSETIMKDTIIFKQTKFINNYAKSNETVYGGAIHSQVSTYFENCLFVENGITGSVNANNNYYDAHGGAIFSNPIYNNVGGKVIIVNSTFDRNYSSANATSAYPTSAVLSYGVWNEQVKRKAYVFNTIITNSKILINGEPFINNDGQYDSFWGGDNNQITVNYSNIEGGTTQSWADDYVYDINPVFNDTANNDYSLSDKSPMIGAGVATWSDEGLTAPTVDILGVTRGSPPDMGAYENSLDASTAPLPVTGLTVAIATSGANLSWSAVKTALGSTTDASNIEYQIYQDGTNVAQTTSTSYSVTSLTNGTAYAFSVSAKNTSTSVEGAASNAVSVTPKYSGPKWYVAASGGSSSNTSDYDLGSSTVPLNHLGSAFELIATGDTIVMMEGTHSGSNNRGINQDGNKSYVVMGHPNYTADKIIIDAGGRDRHFTFDNSEDSTIQIIGLTLYNGKTTSRGGGSIKIENASVKIKNVIFKENYSTGEDWSSSGAVWMSRGSTIIDGCTFDGNYVHNTDGGHNGGAVFAQDQNNGSDTLKIRNSIFKNNYLKTKHEARGGALAVWHAQAIIENNLFYNNYVQSSVGSNDQQNANGGAVYIYNPNYWDNNSQSNKPLIVLLRNNTIANNQVKSDNSQSWLEGGGITINGGDKGLIVSFNNIIWGNEIVGRDQKRQVYHDIWNDDLKVYGDYNNIQNVQSSDQYSRHGDYTVSYDPAFTDSANGDFTLSDKSLSIGAGTTNFEGYNAPSTDILGNARPNPAGSNPDMGSYENALSKSPFPKQVANLTAIGGSGQITLNWDANESSDNVAKYNVYQHTSGFSASSTNLIGNTTTTTYTITGLDNGTRYYFRVSAVNDDGLEGTASSSVDLTPAYSGPVWWVATDGNDNNEGSSASPFASLEHAIEDATEGDTVKIKPGTYTGSKNRGLLIDGKNMVIMSQYPTTWDSVIIDAETRGRHFLLNNNNGADITYDKTKFIGLTLKNGDINSNSNGEGTSASVTLWSKSSATFEKIYFFNNQLQNNHSTSSAGAVYMERPGSIFNYCKFELNESIQSGNGNSRSTGAIGFDGDASDMNYQNIYTLIDGCEFIENRGRNEGGAINARHNTVIQNSLFYKNKADLNGAHGGAIAAMPRVQGDGGWAYDTYLHVINSTFVENSADGGGGAISIYGSNGPIIFNSIFMNNKDENHSHINDFSMAGGNQGQDATVDYIRVNPETIGGDYGNLSWGNNIYTDSPAFTDTTKEDFTLTSASTLIGAGASSYEGVSAPSKDINGNSRPNPSGSNPDLGAYENALAESPYPKQVKNVTATVESGAVNLSWDANTDSDLEKYLIYMSQTSRFEPTSEDSIGESSTNSFSATGLTNRTEYFFRVAAMDLDGYRGAFSQEFSAIPAYQGPTWWISENGNDETGDGSQENPFNSLVWPFHNYDGENDGFFQNGDTIRLMKGNYITTGGIQINNGQINIGDGGNYNTSLSQFTIIGDSDDPSEIRVHANDGGYHFNLTNTDVVFKNITFENGFTFDKGGAIRAEEGDLSFYNCIFENNESNNGGGAVSLSGTKSQFINVEFKSNKVMKGDQSGNSGGGAVLFTPGGSDDIIWEVTFNSCVFEENGIYVTGSTNQGAEGGVFMIDDDDVRVKVMNSEFRDNYVNSPNHNFGSILRVQPFSPNRWDEVPITEFFACKFINNAHRNNGNSYSRGLLFDLGSGIQITNSLFFNNSSVLGSEFISIDANQDSQGNQTFIELNNNTIVSNNNMFDFIRINNYANVELKNNIVWGNTGFDDMPFENNGGNPGTISLFNNIIQKELKDTPNYGGENNITADPILRNPSNQNFQLGNNSPAIDAGIENGIITDIRGYYRVGTPDIGAYEFGASKYLLAMDDDIAADDDTTFVKLSQEITFTVSTNDIDGNMVSSDEKMSWNVFPNQKYVKYVSGDTSTAGGDASATFQVTSQTRGKGFRFRIDAGVGEAFLRSKMYVIEELVTGAPPPVTELTISPDSWTSEPNFTLNWETPIWAEQRDLIGAVVEITDGINVYNEYMGFPSGDTLTAYSFTAPEAGEFEAFLWLIDELGNEHKDSSRIVKAYYDDVAPENFITHNPDSHQGQVFYTSDKPRFEWDDMGDYPSGIRDWQIYINDNHYGTYTRSEVTFDGGSDMGYVNGSTELADGYYTWWVEVSDSAGNTTRSDSAYFGVDLSPPSITHNSPLTVIDENSTSPAINATFSDGASGVKHGRLHYRRSGSNTGFIAADLLSGPVNIPGSDVKSTGVEYYISSEDSVGNRGRWPTDKAMHSVKVKTESAVTTSSRWSSGVPGGTDSTNYVFFSIPFDVGNAKSAITSILDPDNEGPNEFNYRLYGYSNGWQENPSSVTMGNGYFLIYDPDKYSDILQMSFNFGQGTTTPTDPPYSVAVSSGQWKFFGTPYNFDIALDYVYTENDENIRDAGSIYTWNGSWSGAGSTLKPWHGYIYKSGGANQIKIDGRGSGFNKLAKSNNPDDYPMDVNEWVIDMIATTGNARDELNSVGVRHMAEDGYDLLDEFEPPGVPGDVVLRIDNRNRQETPDLYAKDIRKPNEEGHYWDLQVFAPTNGQRTYITFEGLGYVPDEYDVFLINKTTKQAKNLEWDSQYRFANTGSESYIKQELRLVVGTKKFVEDNNAGVSLYPDAFTLAQNYPNPFNPQTSIMISLEEDANVDLIIYNLLGEEITRLAHNDHRPAGYYNFIWNGRNNLGDKVSTGVYFYHALIRNGQGRVVLNKTHKMILLK